MEGGPSNGGLLYHEVQESKLCAVHCVNTVLQGPFFTELDLAALASDLDHTERQMIIEGVPGHSDHFLSEDSHNVSMGGDFSIQVLQKALDVWDLKVIPLDSPVAEPSKHDPELENAYICHLQNHWFCIRKVNGEWYNFNSLYPAPEHLTKFYLSAYLDTLKSGGWSIFLVSGDFPKDCPMSSSDSSNGFGSWFTPEDAKRITNSCNQREIANQRTESLPAPYPREVGSDEDLISEQEQQDLDAAIQASLMDTVTFSAASREKEALGSAPCNTECSNSNTTTDSDSVKTAPEAGNPRDDNDEHPGSASPDFEDGRGENKRSRIET